MIHCIVYILNIIIMINQEKGNGRCSDRGGYRGGGGTFAPLTDSYSYFQNSFSIACLRERNPSAKQEKYMSN